MTRFSWEDLLAIVATAIATVYVMVLLLLQLAAVAAFYALPVVLVLWLAGVLP